MNPALTRLLQLTSPALPVGAYTYSQGLEWAVDSGVVRDEAGALAWIGDQLALNMSRFEAPWLLRMMASHAAGDAVQVAAWDARYLASRESAELRAETIQMGHSLRRLMLDLGEAVTLPAAPSFLCAWSAVAVVWEIGREEAAQAWLWSWAENQVMVALKAVPLGQTAGQRMLRDIGRRIPELAGQAMALASLPGEEALSNFAPGFAIACARHETQYSRLFRS